MYGNCMIPLATIIILLTTPVHNSQIPFGRQLDTQLAKLPPSQHIPYLRNQLHNCASLDLDNHTKETQKQVDSVCRRLQSKLAKGLDREEDGKDFEVIARQVKNCGLAVFLTILYESDRHGFVGSREARWFGVNSVDAVVLALLKQDKWSGFDFMRLPAIDIFDAIMQKGAYILEDERVLQRLYTIYMRKIVLLMVIFYKLSDDAVIVEFNARVKKVVSGNIECAKEHLERAFYDCNCASEQPERDLLISLHPHGHLGFLLDFVKQGLDICCHHLRKISRQDFIALSKEFAGEERWRLQEVYCASLNFTEDQERA